MGGWLELGLRKREAAVLERKKERWDGADLERRRLRLGGLAAALTLGARKSGALLALLALPLCVPTLIFGAGAIEALAAGEGIVTHVAILAALALVALATTPWAIAAALRQAGE